VVVAEAGLKVSRLEREKLHVVYLAGTGRRSPVIPRCYTLTHSDITGELYLHIGADYDRAQVSRLYTRVMRDEVLASWQEGPEGPALNVHCHVSGGLILGWAGMRDKIFRRELPLVLEAFRYGDEGLFSAHPELELSPIWVHFHATQPRYRRTERWGAPGDYRG